MRRPAIALLFANGWGCRLHDQATVFVAHSFVDRMGKLVAGRDPEIPMRGLSRRNVLNSTRRFPRCQVRSTCFTKEKKDGPPASSWDRVKMGFRSTYFLLLVRLKTFLSSYVPSRSRDTVDGKSANEFCSRFTSSKECYFK